MSKTVSKQKKSKTKYVAGIIFLLIAIGIIGNYFESIEEKSTQEIGTVNVTQENVPDSVVEPSQEAVPQYLVDELFQVVQNWVNAANLGQWEEIPALTQRTYRSNNSDEETIQWVKNMYSGIIDLERISISSIKTVKPNVFYAVTIVLDSPDNIYEATFNLIKESAPYQADPNGTWGINPTSGVWQTYKKDNAVVAPVENHQ